MKRPTVEPETLRVCTRVSRWISLSLCIAIYVAVFALGWIGGRASGWRLALPCMLVIAALQNHLLILQHEGAHQLLHPNRAINDFIADVFCAVPFFTILKNYRAFHLTHHRYSGSPERDPEVRGYAGEGFTYSRRSGGALARMLLADLLLVNYLRFARDLGQFIKESRRAGKLAGMTARDGIVNLLVWGSAIGAAVHFGFWRELLIFWVLTQATLLFFLLKLHGYGEHTGATGPTEFERTWVHAFNPVADFFIYPINSGYHLEHHLFPKVPWYHMRAFRRALLADEEYAARAARVTADGYFLGARTIFSTMLLGAGQYRVDELHAETREIGEDDVVSSEMGDEVDAQLGLKPAQAAGERDADRQRQVGH
jgi:fatty acid desaturase